MVVTTHSNRRSLHQISHLGAGAEAVLPTEEVLRGVVQPPEEKAEEEAMLQTEVVLRAPNRFFLRPPPTRPLPDQIRKSFQ